MFFLGVHSTSKDRLKSNEFGVNVLFLGQEQSKNLIPKGSRFIEVWNKYIIYTTNSPEYCVKF